MSLSPTQRAFVTSKAVFPAFCGGYGSGKTAAAIARAMTLKVVCRKQDIAYYLPTFPLIEDIAFRRFPDMLERKGYAYRLNKASANIDFPGAGRILFRSMEKPERIVGYEVSHSIVDELDTLVTDKAREVWNRIISRNRQKCAMPNTVGVATTPEGFRFVYDRWVKNPAAGYVLFKARTADNAANLPAGYMDNLRASYSSNLLSAYLDGEFVNLTAGSVYADFDRKLNACDTAVLPNEALHVGMDFNVAKMAAVVFVMRAGKPHAVMEYTGVFDTPAMCALLKARHAGHSILVYPDASGNSRKSNNASSSDLAILRSAGFTVLVNSTNPAVKDRVLSVNAVLRSRDLRVNPDTCPHLVEALEKQAYTPNGEPDKTAGLDHIMDAAGYFIAYRFPINRMTASTVRITGA